MAISAGAALRTQGQYAAEDGGWSSLV